MTERGPAMSRMKNRLSVYHMESVNKFIDNSLTWPRLRDLVQYLGQSYLWVGLSLRISVINAH